MERMSDRHEGNLGGRLQPFAQTRSVAVAVVVAPETARFPATQHTTWMLINLLTRAVGVVDAIHLVCPRGIPLAGRVVPLAPRHLTLDAALAHGAQATGGVPVGHATAPAPADAVLVVGADPDGDHRGRQGARFVTGDGWWGGVSDRPLPRIDPANGLPFGPYVAAALAVGEIYLRARLPRHVAPPTATYGWDCWTQSLARRPAPVPHDVAGLDLTGTGLAGVGAVGAMWIHALWATPGLTGNVLLADADLKGVTETNLNRCPIFGQASIGQAKAVEAAAVAADATLTWAPHHGRFEQLGVTPDLLVSAVDTNRAREALQNRYPPSMLSASTLDLRAEVLRAGPPGEGACLRCFNPPEAFHGDDDLRATARAGGPDAERALAADANVTVADVQRWLARGECGDVGDRLLETLRRQLPEPPARFAVGFTSAMAGVMLAVETLKLLAEHPLTPGEPTANQATFQFLRPDAPVNGVGRLSREPNCPACAPTNPATRIWQDRLRRGRRAPDQRRPCARPGSG